MLLQVSQVTRRYEGIPLFENISMSIRQRSRIGLVGRNGTGKSSLLKIIAGIEPPDEGSVIKSQDLRIGFLDQHTGLDSHLTIWEEMMTVFDHFIQMEVEMRELEKLITDGEQSSGQNYQGALAKYHHLQEIFDRENAYSYESEIKKVLHGFQFGEDMYQMNVSDLSGGQKTRLALAKLLLARNDLLILDEPTNHLDIETLNWLQKYLKGYPGALMMVSHDRYFLDQLAEEIYEFDHFGHLHHYHGNYSDYLVERAKRLEKAWKDYEKQQKQISDLEEFIAKNLVRASTTKRAQSRRKKLEKMEKLDKPLADQREPNFSFYAARPSGNLVLQTKDLAIGYDDHILSENIDLSIRKGDAIAIVGPNGIGKTTLLKTIVGMIPQIKGEIELGTKVDLGYFDQEQLNLDRHQTVLDELWAEQPTFTEEQIRTFLGSFLFTQDDVKKSIHSLSGGERARVALAKLAINQNNFLVLDEPTNHLDLDSKEVLESALIDFDGTILFVSHDRYFINRIADKVIELDENTSTLYLGDYDYYLAKKEQLEAIAEYQREQQSISENLEKSDSIENDWERQKAKEREQRKLKRKLEACEIDIIQLEEIIEDLESKMAKPEIYEDQEKMVALTQDYQKNKKSLNDLYEKWEELAEKLANEFDKNV